MMKGFRLIAMLLAALMTAVPLTVSAEPATRKKLPITMFDFDEDPEGAMVYYNRDSGISLPARFEIPAVFEGKPVYGIADNGFTCVDELVYVKIPDSAVLIGKHAFGSCKNLKQVDLSSSLIGIDESGFGYCYALESIFLPDSLTNLGQNAFGASGIKSVRFSPNLAVMGHGCFYACDNLTEVTLPASLKTLGTQAFRNCKNLKTAIVEGSVCAEQTFCECTALESVTFLDPDCDICIYGTTVCNELLSVSKGVYNGVIRGYVGSTAQEYAEHWNYRFEPLDPENYVTTTAPVETEPVPDWWWGDTTAPDPSVTTAKPVTTTTTVTTTVTTAPVTTTKPVTTTTSPFDAENKLVLDGICYQKKGSTVEVCGYQEGGVPKDLLIPEDIEGLPVRTIGEKALAKMKGVESVTLPVNVTAIEKDAFYWCSDLKTLTILNPEIRLNGGATLICNDDLGIYTGVLRAYVPSETSAFCQKHEMRFEALKEVRGDITLDGIVSIEDAQNTLKVYTESIAGKPGTLIDLQKRTADVDGSLTISVEDAQLILKYYTERSVAGKNITWEDLLKGVTI